MAAGEAWLKPVVIRCDECPWPVYLSLRAVAVQEGRTIRVRLDPAVIVAAVRAHQVQHR